MRISKFNTKSRSAFQGGCRESNAVVVKSSRWLATVRMNGRWKLKMARKWKARKKPARKNCKGYQRTQGATVPLTFLPPTIVGVYVVRNNNILVGKAAGALNQMFVITDWCWFSAGAIDPLIQFDEWYSSYVARTFAAYIGDRTYSHNIS